MYDGHLVRLRTLEPGDTETLHRWINDPEVGQYLAIRYPISMASETEWVAGTKSVGYGSAVFAVERIEDGLLIGCCDVRTPTGPENRKGELGLMIGEKSVWDQGYGTDLVRTVCRFGFDEMNLNRIELWVHSSNPRAKHVYENVGFVTEGVARQGWYKNGEYLDMILMGMLRDEFKRTGQASSDS